MLFRLTDEKETSTEGYTELLLELMRKTNPDLIVDTCEDLQVVIAELGHGLFYI